MGKSRGRKQDRPYRSHDRSGTRTSTQNRGKDKRSAQVAEERVLEYFPEFHSAVNRIPLPRQSVLDDVRQRNLPSVIFGDEQAFGHDHLAPDRWHGSFELEMTVRTPLVFGERKESEGDEENNVVSLPRLRRKHDGEVLEEFFMPSTMLKGMVSRAYEVVTASRFRVFGKHDQPLTYRSDVAEARPLILARVTRVKGILKIKVPRASRKPKVCLIPDTQEMADKVGADLEQLRSKLQPREKPYWVRTKTVDKRAYVIEVLEEKGKDGEAVKGHVLRVAAEGATSEDMRPLGSGKRQEISKGEEEGSSKKCERLLVVLEANEGTTYELTEDHLVRYQRILDSYIEQHRAREPKSGEARDAWEKSLNRAATVEKRNPGRGLQEHDLVFVVPKGPRGPESLSVFDIVPTMVGRRTYDHSPRSLAETQVVLPLEKCDQASPADRMFGYVVQRSEKEGAPTEAEHGEKERLCNGDVAYRGRISFGPVTIPSSAVAESPQMLPVLLGANLGSARRFLTGSEGETERGNSRMLRRSRYFRDGQMLGTAAFPVHRKLLDAPSFPSFEHVNTNDMDLDQSNEAVRTKALNWVRPGAVLRCQVRFTNLVDSELAILLWLLKPENLVPEEERRKKGSVGFLRVGLGKPYGLGAMEVRVANGSLHACKGEGLSQDYESLEGCLGAVVSETTIEELPAVLDVETRQRPWIQAFLRSAHGYSDDFPVRHMTLGENKKNNQTDRYGAPRVDAGISPRDMWGPEQAKPLQVPKRWETDKQ